MIVNPKEIIANPDAAELKRMVSEMPNARLTEYGNYNVETKVLARSKASTFIVSDEPQEHTDQTITREKANAMAKLQDDYIAGQTMIVTDGYIGPNPGTRIAVRMIVEKANANIAAMQRQLYFTPSNEEEFKNFKPDLNVIYTPNLKAEGFPNDRLISVDLDNSVTRVFNSDYFGESKKGGLRMWNKTMYDKGGLPMHAGCKAIPVGTTWKVGLIVGLSGTGKTTTTFTSQNNSRPIQDDFVALMPDGTVVPTENGCFAKTYGLDQKSEPMIHHAVTRPQSYLENVYQNEHGKLDFFNESYTQNGRATFPFSLLPDGAPDFSRVHKVDFVLILNRNDNIIPAVTRLSAEQAAAYFMLGETQGTAAGGKEEAGKALRVPGTNPFFPLLHGDQGTRFFDLVNKMGTKVYLMNTGWVGGAKGTEHSKKVGIQHSSAVVKAIAEDTIQWEQDENFGYDVATFVPGIDKEDSALLQPWTYYIDTNRNEEYATIVNKLKSDRREHLMKYPGLSADIIDAIS
jgi:phosphoenolpyruvate carboxykinase (ATP)